MPLLLDQIRESIPFRLVYSRSSHTSWFGGAFYIAPWATKAAPDESRNSTSPVLGFDISGKCGRNVAAGAADAARAFLRLHDHRTANLY
jgi:hypothetical protein